METRVHHRPGTEAAGGSRERIEAIDEETRAKVMESLRAQFLPEFLNRLDEVILFHGLDRDHIARIVEIQVRRLQEQLKDLNLQLDLTDSAKRQLAEEGYDPVYGARPLKRVIQQRLQNRLASEMLEGKHAGRSSVLVDFRNGQFDFLNGATKQPAGAEKR